MPGDHKATSDFENFHHPISWSYCQGDMLLNISTDAAILPSIISF